MRAPQTVVTETIDVPIDAAFMHIVPVDLSRIFKRYKNLPAVVRTDESEEWITPGLVRTVYFDDGTTARETLLTVDRPNSFSYQVDSFTSVLRRLAKRVEGDWVFTQLGPERTEIRWTYQVIPTNVVAGWIVKGFVLRRVNSVLTNAMTILKHDVEASEGAKRHDAP